MAHEIEMINGEASFASLREPAWHGLGTVFNDEEISTKEMLELANLQEWNVRLEEVEAPATLTSDKNYFYVVRDNPVIENQNDILGIVGERYNVLQNEELFDFADAMLDGGRWETAGSLRGGRVVFGSLALDRETVLDPNGVADKINTYLVVNTSHDGSISIQASVTPVRVVCANTLNFALRSVKQTFKIRHTQTANGKVQSAKTALGIANAYMDDFSVMANKMIQTELSAKQFNDILLTAYPKPDKDSKQALTKWTNKIDMLNDIYTGEFNHMISGNAWGALNAMTERIDWFRGQGETKLAAASGFDVATNAEKNRLLKVVQNVMQIA
jgi:phage/plasmid-like protein (TIGR03299 family)